MMNRKQEIEIEHGTSEIDTHGGRGGKAAFSLVYVDVVDSVAVVDKKDKVDLVD